MSEQYYESLKGIGDRLRRAQTSERPRDLHTSKRTLAEDFAKLNKLELRHEPLLCWVPKKERAGRLLALIKFLRLAG